ncbi:hypothetical protein D3C73_1626900 [compost metagenome]
MRGVTFEKEPGEYVGILLPGQLFSEDDLLLLAELIRDNLRKWLKLSVTIVVG